MVVIAATNGAGLHRLQIAAGGGFGHCDRRYPFAGAELWQPAPLLLVIAVGVQVMCANGPVQGLGKGAAADISQLLRDDSLVSEGAAAAAILLGNAGAENAHLAGLPEELAVDAMLLLPAVIVRRRLVGQEAADGVAYDRQVRGHPRNGARVVPGTSPRASMLLDVQVPRCPK